MAPLLILLFVGSFQLSDAIAASRKVTITARALADLASQYTSMSDATAEMILGASAQLMSPYSPSDGTFTLTLVSTNNGGVSKVNWSKKLENGVTRDGYDKNSDFNLPGPAANAGTSVLVADVSYSYRPVITPKIFGQHMITSRIYMLPRRSVDIPFE